MDWEFWQTLQLTFRLAGLTTLLLFLIGVPFAFYLAFLKSPWKPIFESLISLPLVLPPTVLGFYLLLIFNPETLLSQWLNEVFGVKLLFSFPGLVLASIIYSLPFMVQPLQTGFENLPPNLAESSYLLGKSKATTLIKILIPNIKPAILSGIVLSFAHTVGEFGVILMIGGNIPGVTKVASIAIYDEVESLNYTTANQYALILIGMSFIFLFLIYFNNYRTNRTRKKQ
ncbi:MAG: molybdate ABC transporter permease subunit [Saprospiraceae bacterium]|jgi:molybdate transport system permease protein